MNLFRAGLFTLAVLAAPACKTSPDTQTTTTKSNVTEAEAPCDPDEPESVPCVVKSHGVVPKGAAGTSVVTLTFNHITRDDDAGTVTLEADTSVAKDTYNTWIFDAESYDAVVADSLKEGHPLKVRVITVVQETRLLVAAEGQPNHVEGINHIINRGQVLSLAP